MRQLNMRPPGHPISTVEFERDVRAGLSKTDQKELYSKYLYDDLGTALFETITLLPEYGLTRADLRLLRKNARELPRWIDDLSVVVELGSGSGDKAREILPVLAERPLTYCPIDLSYEGGEIMVSEAPTDRPLRLGVDEASALLVALRMLAEVPGLEDRSALSRTIAKLEAAAGEAAVASAQVAVQVPPPSPQPGMIGARS